MGEWQRVWAREKSAVAFTGVLLELGGTGVVAFAWNSIFSLATPKRGT